MSSEPVPRPLILFAAGILLLIAVVYAPVASHDFVNFDDETLVVDNPHVSSGLGVSNIGWAFAHPYVGSGGPLTWVSHMIDAQIFGLRPGAHHVVNVVMHAINAMLLLLLAWRLTGSIGGSAFVAALFAVHPLNVEPVAWIAQRKELLSTMLLLLTLLAYARYAAQPDRSRYRIVFVLLTLGLLAQPMLVTVPFVLLLLDWWPLERFTRARASRLVVEKLPLLVPVTAAAVMAFIDQRRIGAVSTFSVVPFSARMANAVESYVIYLGNLIWPVNLAVLYPYRESVSVIAVVLCALLLIGLSFLAIRLASRAPWALVGWGWYVMTLVPVIGLVQAGAHAMADRYAYVPALGIFLVVAGTAWAWLPRVGAGRPVIAAAGAAIVLACAVVARAQVPYWQDSVTLWKHAIAVTPSNGVAHAKLGEALAQLGQTTPAIDEYAEALRLSPNLAQAQNNLALALRRQGRDTDALSHFQKAIDIRPDYAQARNNLASLLFDLGQPDEAIRQWREAIRMNPDLAGARVNLGLALAGRGQVKEAIALVLEATLQDPLESRWHDVLGALYIQQGRREEGIIELQTALRLNPSDQKAREILARFGR